MALIPANIVAEIRDRTDIVVVIAEHVPLRRAGANHQGLCPFHQEKSPSFTVSAAKQFFYCFGCQKTGDVFRFLMDLTGRSFVEVATELAGRAGVSIPEPTPSHPRSRNARSSPSDSGREGSPESEERSRLLRLNELAARFFTAELERSDRAQKYLGERRVSAEMRSRFRLGYAPDAWDGLLRVLVEKRVPHELCEQAGLLIRREGSPALPPRTPPTSATHYDRFRDRIIFPLMVSGGGKAQTALGDVVAFGGRVLPSDNEAPGAKYINSPETPIYKKGDQLYGLHAARDAVRKGRQVILVEGNFDVIALHQQGFDNTVAPMGTALTETQARLLSRLIGEDGHVVLMLDGDRAGRSATMKDIFLFSETRLRDVAMLSGRDIDVRVARLPDGEDPDTFAHRDRDGLARTIGSARSALDHVLDETVAQADSGSVNGRARALERVAPLLLGLRNKTVQSMHVDRVSSALGVRPELLWQHIETLASRSAPSGLSTHSTNRPATAAPATPPRPPQRSARPTAPSSKTDDTLALNLMALIGDHLHLLAYLDEEVLDSLENPVLSELLRQACEETARGEPFSVEKMINLAPEEARSQVVTAALSGKYQHTEHPEQELSRISQQLRARAIQREVRDLTQQLVRAQRSQDPTASQNICQRILELTQLREQLLGNHDQGRPAPGAPMETGTVAGEHAR